MPFFQVGALPLQVVDFQESGPELVGTEKRSWSGKLRQAISGEVRKWTCGVLEMTHAEYTTLRNTVKLGAHVECFGDAWGGPTVKVCRVRITGAPYQRDKTGFLIGATLEIETVNPET